MPNVLLCLRMKNTYKHPGFSKASPETTHSPATGQRALKPKGAKSSSLYAQSILNLKLPQRHTYKIEVALEPFYDHPGNNRPKFNYEKLFRVIEHHSIAQLYNQDHSYILQL